MKTSLAAPTKYEAERIEAMKSLGCVACAVLEVPNVNDLELHHLLSGGVRMGHWYTVFLCRGHHQGDWRGLEWIDPEQKIAISDGRKRFAAVYGTERSLWERVQGRLKLMAVWPSSKIVPRRACPLFSVRPASSGSKDDSEAESASSPPIEVLP